MVGLNTDVCLQRPAGGHDGVATLTQPSQSDGCCEHLVRACRGLQVDTVAWPPFQGPGGQARPLAALARQLLGRSIQAGGCHSARCSGSPHVAPVQASVLDGRIAPAFAGMGKSSGELLCREDAQAVLELYMQYVIRDTTCMDADALRAYELQQIMAHVQQNIDVKENSG